MTPELFEAVSANLAAHEGRRLSMYLDTVGVVTAGVGHAFFCAADAAKYLWWKNVGEIATKDEITREWDWVKRRQLLRGKLILSFDETEHILQCDLVRFEKIVHETFPDADSYPNSALVAIYDICFNTGSFAHWPNFTAAVRAKDWQKAAEMSNRPQVSKERNEATYKQLLMAGSVI